MREIHDPIARNPRSQCEDTRHGMGTPFTPRHQGRGSRGRLDRRPSAPPPPRPPPVPPKPDCRQRQAPRKPPRRPPAMPCGRCSATTGSRSGGWRRRAPARPRAKTFGEQPAAPPASPGQHQEPVAGMVEGVGPQAAAPMAAARHRRQAFAFHLHASMVVGVPLPGVAGPDGRHDLPFEYRWQRRPWRGLPAASRRRQRRLERRSWRQAGQRLTPPAGPLASTARAA